MRKVRLCTQAVNPSGRAEAFCRIWEPRGFKVVIVNHGDFVLWWPNFPPDTLVVGRWYGPRGGDVDGYAWDAHHAQLLADEQAACRDAGNWRIDVWECINEPVVNSADDMKRLRDFELRWVEIMHGRGMKTCVGNFPVGNPPTIEWMEHFHGAIAESDWFGQHGYGGSPNILDDKEWLLFRHRKLLEAAGLPNHPTMLTEFGLDEGGQGHGYKTYLSDEEYISQLKRADQELRSTNDPALYAFIFCHGSYGGWKTFDLTDPAAVMLGQYIAQEGDISEVGLVLTACYRFEGLDWTEIGSMYPDEVPGLSREYRLSWEIPREGTVTLRYKLFVDGEEKAQRETGAFVVDWTTEEYVIEAVTPKGGETITARRIELEVRLHQDGGDFSLRNLLRRIGGRGRF